MSLSLFKNRDNKFIKDNFQKLIFENFTFFFRILTYRYMCFVNDMMEID